MLIIGLTGGIASGKSTIARFMKRQRIPVFDSDHAVHQLMGPKGEAVDKILAIFGNVGSCETGIDRPALGAAVFADKQKLTALEQILHPMVHEKREKLRKNAQMSRKKALIFDVPLLFETGTDQLCDVTIMAWAPLFLIKQRALRRPHMTQEKLDQILANQMRYHERAKLADYQIATGLGHGAMTAQLKRLLCKWHLR